MPLELLSGRGQRGSRFVPHEELGTECFLQTLNARADGGLRDVQSLSRLDEAACCDHDEECAGEFGIHRNRRYITPIFIACKRDEQS